MSNIAQEYTIPVVGHFEKVSLFQFQNAMKEEFCSMFDDELIQFFYDRIIEPSRATEGSSGHDFFSPFPFRLEDGQEIKIPTGIRVKMIPGWWLMCMPRSGSGFKYYVRLANTIGDIDEDFYYTNTEGHIWLKIRPENNQGKPFVVARGDGIMQAVFLPFGIADNDRPRGKRVGGLGSTDKK